MRRSADQSIERHTGQLSPKEGIAQAVIDGLDETARQMELKWGVGRLRLLIDDDLRMRFDAQKAKLDAALASNQAGYIRSQGEGMRRAWSALDKAATEAGEVPLSPEVWECRLPSSGEVVSIVRTEPEAYHVVRDGEVWTMAEVAVLIERLGHEARQVKRTFPGSAVVDIGGRDPPDGDPPF